MTHMATCASQDWAWVDRIVVESFVTASQAWRKWYTKVIASVASEGYRLGAVSDVFFFGFVVFVWGFFGGGVFWWRRLIGCVWNSANIIVQNRLTGQLEEEKMQVYVRLGIRLLYKVRVRDSCHVLCCMLRSSSSPVTYR